MKTIDKNFKIKNLRNIFLSATAGIIPCLFLQERSFIIYGVLYLYLAFPLLIIFFGGKIKKIKEHDLVEIAGRLYKRRRIEYLPFLISTTIFLCIFLRGVSENVLKLYLPSNLIFCLPFLTYHAFCAVFSHPLSILKSFYLLKELSNKGRPYVHHNPHFPSSQSFHRTGFSDNSVNSPFSFQNTFSSHHSFKSSDNWSSPSYRNFHNSHAHQSFSSSSSNFHNPFSHPSDPIDLRSINTLNDHNLFRRH